MIRRCYYERASEAVCYSSSQTAAETCINAVTQTQHASNHTNKEMSKMKIVTEQELSQRGAKNVHDKTRLS